MTPQCAGLPEIPAGRRSSHTPRPTPGARPVPCPYCGTTTAVRQTSDTGRIQAWACDRCNTDWAFTAPDSRTAAPLGDLGATAEEIPAPALEAGPGRRGGQRCAWGSPIGSCGTGCWHWPSRAPGAPARVGYLAAGF
jgi:hypothetical protein